MPYKQNNPFNGPANFRNPKNKGTSNFNALEFQMPDLSQILNKTADGDSKTVDVTNESTTGSSEEGKVDKNTVPKSNTEITVNKSDDTIDDVASKATAEDDPTYKDIAAKDKERRKELNQEIREARRMQKDRKNVLDYSQRQSAKQAKEDMIAQRKFERKARRQGMSVDQALENLYTVNKMKEIEAKQKGQSMKQVNNKGAGFPMVNPATQVDQMGNPIPQPPVKGTMANGGRPLNSNVLVNDPMNYQDPSKISAQQNAQAMKMNEIAHSAGTPTPRYNPYNNEMTGMAFNDKLRAASAAGDLDDNPNFKDAVDGAPSMVHVDPPGSLKPMTSAMRIKDKPKEEEKPVIKLEGNDGPDGKPKPLVASPGMYGKGPSQNKDPKDLRTTPMTDAQKKKYEEAVQSYQDSTATWISGKGPEPKVPDYDSFKLSKLTEKGTGMYESNGPASFKSLVAKLRREGKSKESAEKIAGSIANYKAEGGGTGPTAAQKARMGTAMHSMDHAHTRVTKKNLKATERDDAAHMDYLKRDVKDIQKSKMSQRKKDEYETADEKHISKLAGDLKYDTKYHGRKYDNV